MLCPYLWLSLPKAWLIFDNIVIISPYKAHCQYLKNISNNDIEIHTLDSFQGREADVILLNTVRTGNSVGFWNDYRRLNVGMTRAKHVLRIIGSTDTWNSQMGPLKQLYEFIHQV